MSVIIDQPECRLLDCIEACEDIVDLEILKDIDQVIIKENDHRLGGKNDNTVCVMQQWCYTLGVTLLLLEY